jgi:hypothetical protein
VTFCRHRVYLASSDHDRAETVLVVTSGVIHFVWFLRETSWTSWPGLGVTVDSCNGRLAEVGIGTSRGWPWQTDRHGPHQERFPLPFSARH